jgi:tRNA pseudouridine38-40 synthase
LEQAIAVVTKVSHRINGSGRTDAGVHALGQVVNFRTTASIPTDRFVPALNSVLPRDIVVTEAEEVPLDFHARFSAKRKTYRYWIETGKVPNVLRRRYSHFVSVPLNLDRLKQAAQRLVGEHDFASFQASGSNVKTTVRRIYRLDVTSNPDGLIEIEVEANGFLYNMVRIIVGTLIEVGRGKLAPEEIDDILAARDRNAAGPTAPPQGLCLLRVDY